MSANIAISSEHRLQADDGEPLPRVSVLIASRNRPAALAKSIRSVLTQKCSAEVEIAVLDDASDVPLRGVIEADIAQSEVTWLRSDTPGGVSRARNTLVESANGDILVFIDDDAWFVEDTALDTVVQIFQREQPPGIVAFKIHVDERGSGELQVPFGRRAIAGDPAIAERAQLASYFVGAGHAINRKVFDECGPYPGEFVYGHEELDLSYRAINHGFTIFYDPSIEAVHSPDTSQVAGAGRKRFEAYYSTRNRIWLAHRNLPWKYALSYSVAWSVYYLLKSLQHRRLGGWVLAIKDGLLGLDRSKRTVLSPDAVRYLSQHHGRLWR